MNVLGKKILTYLLEKIKILLTQELEKKADKNQGEENQGKYWKVGANGDLTFDTLSSNSTGVYCDVTNLSNYKNNNEKLFGAINSGYSKLTTNKKEMVLASETWREITSDFEIFEAVLKGSATELTLVSQATQRNLVFENVIFDDVALSFYFSGTVTFKNCHFKNNKYAAIFAHSDDLHIIFIDSKVTDTRPYVSEWIANTDAVQYWRYNCINVYGNNCAITVENSKFYNIMAAHFIYLPEGKTGCKFYIKNNVFDTIEGNGIAFETAVAGYIRNNIFRNIGELRGSYGEGDRTDGVGTNAIFTKNNVYCDMDVSDNYIYNANENGIEGSYRSVCRNRIENTGYRNDLGYTNPSTEGIWGGSRLIKDNVIINPYTKGIIMEGWGNAKCIIENNTILCDEERQSECIQVTCASGNDSNLMFINNVIDSNYVLRYNFIDGGASSLSNVKIYDILADTSVINVTGPTWYPK